MTVVMTMSFDGIMLGHVVEDLVETMQHGRITKIYQLGTYDLLLQVRTVKTHRLLISASPKYTRIHRTLNTYETPPHPPMFCMFLRKHLEGAIIERIAQHDNDRVVTLTVRVTDELGDLTRKHLIFEAMGKDANILLTHEDGTILEALKHTGPFDEQARTIMPSAMYTYPDDPRVNPFDRLALAEALQTTEPAMHARLQKISGVSPLFLTEFDFRLKTHGASALDTFTAMLNERHYTIVSGRKTVYYCLKLTHLDGQTSTHTSVPELFDAYFFERDQADKRKQKARDLEKFLKRQIEKLRGKLLNLEQDLRAAQDLDRFRIQGELLLANRHAIEKGDRAVTVENYYTGLMVTIPLEADKSALANSERYFKKYKKLKKSIPHVKKQRSATKDDLEYFLLLKSQLEHANLADIEEMREELVSEGFLRARKQTSKRAMRSARYTLYEDALGVEILVGKNNHQNSRITHQEAKHFHVWFHVQNAPGSHVVVKQGFPLEETTLRTAAQLAAFHSPMKDSSSVAVDYTEVRHIKKIPGKRLCFVTYTQQKTIYIDPDADFIRALTLKR
ncbi:MAG: fibronectin-binding domain-containing protein [Acholeplasmatales bacterium]|nr:MAG: fibronectin-binding domain-containing protein [Acholeplasmatales bacterium]